MRRANGGGSGRVGERENKNWQKSHFPLKLSFPFHVFVHRPTDRRTNEPPASMAAVAAPASDVDEAKTFKSPSPQLTQHSNVHPPIANSSLVSLEYKTSFSEGFPASQRSLPLATVLRNPGARRRPFTHFPFSHMPYWLLGGGPPQHAGL